MVTINTIRGQSKTNGKEIGAYPQECLGLSADEKPENVLNGSTFYEMDTGDSFMFDAENKIWYPI